MALEGAAVDQCPAFECNAPGLGRIGPLANLVRSEQHTVYGILAQATHRELDRLYAHACDVLGGIYLPEAVVVHTLDGALVPALCYIRP